MTDVNYKIQEVIKRGMAHLCPKCGSVMFRNVRVTGRNLETGQLESEEFDYCPKGCGHSEKVTGEQNGGRKR